MPGDGQGGHDHGQVSLDSITLVVEHGPGSQVVLTHPEGLPGRATARDTRRPPHPAQDAGRRRAGPPPGPLVMGVSSRVSGSGAMR